MPDIVITPNRGTTSNPKIDFTGTSAGTIKLEVLADGSIAWNGANGSLFSIADSLSGSLMSVNDISGLPAFEVFSDNRVIVGQFGAKLGIGITNPSYKLDVSGTARISGATIFSSATTFNGGNGSQVNGNGSTLSLTVNGNWNSGVGSLIQLTTSDLNFWSNGGIYYFKNSAGGNVATINSTNGNIETTGGFAANKDGDYSNLVNGISLWGSSNATTSISYFKRWSAIFGRTNTLLTENPGYATYHVMDTAGRGWVWRYISSNNTTTGTNVASLRNDTGQMSLGTAWDWSGGYHAQLNIAAGQGSATTYRDIDLHGGWLPGEGHAITATHASGATNIVGQIVFQYDGGPSRIRFGKIHYNGDTSSYPLELISTSATEANLILNNGNVGIRITPSDEDKKIISKYEGGLVDVTLNYILDTTLKHAFNIEDEKESSVAWSKTMAPFNNGYGIPAIEVFYNLYKTLTDGENAGSMRIAAWGAGSTLLAFKDAFLNRVQVQNSYDTPDKVQALVEELPTLIKGWDNLAKGYMMMQTGKLVSKHGNPRQLVASHGDAFGRMFGVYTREELEAFKNIDVEKGKRAAQKALENEIFNFVMKNRQDILGMNKHYRAAEYDRLLHIFGHDDPESAGKIKINLEKRFFFANKDLETALIPQLQAGLRDSIQKVENAREETTEGSSLSELIDVLKGIFK